MLGRPKGKILGKKTPRKAQQLSQRRVSVTWEDEQLDARGENLKTEDKGKPQESPRNIPTSGIYT